MQGLEILQHKFLKLLKSCGFNFFEELQELVEGFQELCARKSCCSFK